MMKDTELKKNQITFKKMKDIEKSNSKFCDLIQKGKMSKF